jgi:hypothetical protein
MYLKRQNEVVYLFVCESLLLCPSAGPAEEVREDKAHAQSAAEEAW